MTLRRGFKSEASELAKEVRAELGLGPFDRLDPRELAEYLDIPIMSLSELAPDVSGARYFLFEEQDSFSALTVFAGSQRMVVHNNSHSEARQNSNLTHELAHALLLHIPVPALDAITGCRNWDDTIEQEAAWLSGELLVSREMALAAARGRPTQLQARQRLGVSEWMLQWRINSTGAAKRVERERRSRPSLEIVG